MELLTEERDKLLMHVDDGQKLLQPSRSLPDDILREIFTCCIPHPDDTGYSSLNSRNAPWSLSHVSSRWRRVVLSTPSLWTTLSFAFPTSMEPAYPDVALLARFSYNLTLFLSRSKDCSLTVHLRCPTKIEIHPFIFNTLQVSALRWSYLRFEARNCLLSALFEMSFERLDSLFVAEHSERSRPRDPFIQRGDLRAPVLCSVRVLGGDLGRARLPWKTLISYECELLPRSNAPFLAHLASMSALEQLTIKYLDSVTAKTIPQLSLPMLRSLTLTSGKPRVYSDFLPKLSAPGLKQLSLNYSYELTYEPDSSIVLPNVPTLMRQLRSLEVATYRATTDTCVDLHTWLQQAVDVTRFTLKTPFITDELLDRLVVREDALLPKLELLQLNLGSGQNWDHLCSLLDLQKGHCVIELKEW
ncbi:hypothetical protein BDZ89DRAFT_990001 [Hymenopellis radicata]|nr:hypothetical protein BDZ89DRAFT_990001 [Hymenopellis radicata]